MHEKENHAQHGQSKRQGAPDAARARLADGEQLPEQAFEFVADGKDRRADGNEAAAERARLGGGKAERFTDLAFGREIQHHPVVLVLPCVEENVVTHVGLHEADLAGTERRFAPLDLEQNRSIQAVVDFDLARMGVLGQRLLGGDVAGEGDFLDEGEAFPLHRNRFPYPCVRLSHPGRRDAPVRRAIHENAIGLISDSRLHGLNYIIG